MHLKKLAALLLALCFAVFACSCGASPDPKNAVSAALDALKAMDLDTVRQYMDYDGMMNESEGSASEETEEMNRQMFSRLSYHLGETKVDGDTATVQAKITNMDMAKVLQAYFDELYNMAGDSDENISDEKMEEVLREILGREDNETVTNEVTIKLAKKDGGWQIQATDELANALTGGFFSLVNQMAETFLTPSQE